MEGINRALKKKSFSKSYRILESIKSDDVPCVFISYQRKDEVFAGDVAKYIMSKQLDVNFDLEDNDLKHGNQADNPKKVTNAIRNGLKGSDYMIVIVSPNTYKSLWVPFEIGYAFDEKGEKMKILRHKEIVKGNMPAYLKVKELLHGTEALNKFIHSIRQQYRIYESLIQKGEQRRIFSEHYSNPLNKYLDNE